VTASLLKIFLSKRTYRNNSRKKYISKIFSTSFSLIKRYIYKHMQKTRTNLTLRRRKLIFFTAIKNLLRYLFKYLNNMICRCYFTVYKVFHMYENRDKILFCLTLKY